MRLYLGTTSHERRTPVKHAFRYPVVYVGVDLHPTNDNPRSSSTTDQPLVLDGMRQLNLFGQRVLRRFIAGSRLGLDDGFGLECSPWAVLQVRGDDYLVDGNMSSDGTGTGTGTDARSTLWQRVLWHVAKMRPDIDIGNISRIHLVTMPRWFGYAFNPVNFLFIYGRDRTQDGNTRLLFLLLEVHNTFGEAHLYLLDVDHTNSHSLPSSPSTTTLKRQFHVSPFNDGSGYYEISFRDPFDDVEGEEESSKNGTKNSNDSDQHDLPLSLLIIQRLSAARTPTNVKFIADIRAKALDFGWWALLVLCVWFPMTIFLTVPRILYQAGLLAYRRRLPIYPRPEPRVAATITKVGPEPFEEWCMRKVIDCMRRALADHDKTLDVRVAICTPRMPHILVHDSNTATSTMILRFACYEPFVWMLVAQNLVDALTAQLVRDEGKGTWSVALVEGKIDVTSADVTIDDVIATIGDAPWNCKEALSSFYIHIIQPMSEAATTSPMPSHHARILRTFINRYLIPPLSSTSTSPLFFAIDDHLTISDRYALTWGLVSWLAKHVVFETITHWAKHTSPAPWSVVERSRAASGELQTVPLGGDSIAHFWTQVTNTAKSMYGEKHVHNE